MDRIFIQGLPVAQPRTKATLRGAHASVYTPSTADAWKATVAAAVGLHIAAPLRDGVWMEVVFHLRRPIGHFRTGKRAGELRESAPQSHTGKPDLDNLVKALKDALKGIAWLDDGQVVSCRSVKIWTTLRSGCYLRIVGVDE